MSTPSPVLGIDFGTSNTAAAWVDAKNRVRVVPVREGVYLLPSIAWYSERGEALVGDAARQQLLEDPAHTVHGTKRFIGRRWTSPFVHRHKDNFGYRMVESADGHVAIDLFGKKKPIDDVAVDILKRIVELAQASIRQPVKECTLTVPAHYGFSQRQAIRAAAMKAGLNVKAMVNEPTAAAMYYARKKGDDGTVLIFDLGGGTFDATVLGIMGGIVKVLATGGDAFLGGQDFDGRIVEHLASRFERDTGIDLRPQTVALWRLFVASETAKVALSTQDEARVRVPCVTVKEDRFLDLDYLVTRRELEDLTAPLIERCLGICEDILTRSRLKPTDVAEIVFVGGQTRMPAIQRRLAQVFNSNPAKHIHPDLGVAVGAALLARGEQSLIDVVSAPLGVMVPGVGAKELIPANTTVPSVKRLSLGMRPKAGSPLVMAVYESPDANSLEREHLGTTRADAAWLEKNPGDLELEAWVGDDLSLSLSLRASGGGRLPLMLDQPHADETARSDASPAVEFDADAITEPETTKKKAQKDGDETTNIDPPGAGPASTTSKPSRRSSSSLPGGDAAGKRAPMPPGFKSIDVGLASDAGRNASVDNVSQKATLDSQMLAPGAGKRKKPSSSPPPPGPAASGDVTAIRGESTGVKGSGKEEGDIPQAGEMVGSYRLLEVIGRGGMGRVYLAEHTVLGRKVALKMLRKRFSDNRQAVERFITEARAVNQIRHEHIIQVTDFIEAQGGHTCFIMELLEGKSVAERLQDSGILELDEALEIAAQVADAMVAVHDAAIIHRDLKPENIFLTSQQGSERFVKLLDFGVAKLVDNEGRSVHETGLGDALGTPEYMSPEQLVGGRVDHRSDIYSLGVVLYEMLTGQKPFDVDHSAGDAVFQQLTQRPVPPSERKGAPEEMTDDLEQLVIQCLDKEVTKRPRSMREVRGRLQAMLERRALLNRTTRQLSPAKESDTLSAVAAAGFEDDKTVAGGPPGIATERAPWGVTDPGNMDLVLLPGEILRATAPPSPKAPPPANVVAPPPRPPPPEFPRTSVPTPDVPPPPPTVHLAERDRDRRRAVVIAAALGAAMAVLIALAAWALSGEDDEQVLVSPIANVDPLPPEPVATPMPAPAPAPAPAKPPDRVKAAPLPEKVRITFDSKPAGASVYLPGRDKRLGVTPFAVTVRPSRAAQEFEFRLDGYRDKREVMQPPTGDTTFSVELSKK